MFGYATDETEECMPLTVVLAHRLNQKIAELRRSGVLTWARPDSKTQVSFVVIYIFYFHFAFIMMLKKHSNIYRINLHELRNFLLIKTSSKE